jgi:hypothetical protein
MREIDIYVGQKYRVKEDVASYIKRGAVVVIRKKDGEFIAYKIYLKINIWMVAGGYITVV